jgi:O-antigen/teichoic acid export membrane protein
MDQTTKDILMRWRSLENGDGLALAASRVKILWGVGLILCCGVVFGVMYGVHSAGIAIAATALGWVVAETNALRSRLKQWPIFKQYIDWQRVHQDIDKPG